MVCQRLGGGLPLKPQRPSGPPKRALPGSVLPTLLPSLLPLPAWRVQVLWLLIFLSYLASVAHPQSCELSSANHYASWVLMLVWFAVQALITVLATGVSLLGEALGQRAGHSWD